MSSVGSEGPQEESILQRLTADAGRLPRFAPILVKHATPRLINVPVAIRRSLEAIDFSDLLTAGMRIAIAVGSRGISDIPAVLSVLVAELASAGAKPFIVPAMGSHGGATAEGQTNILESLGISPEVVGAPIRASMEVIELGRTVEGTDVFLDRMASEAEGIVVVNRVREHTDFYGPIQSGLMKMLAIGLGKVEGAAAIHARGSAEMAVHIPAVARHVLRSAPVTFGLALVENGQNQIAEVRCARRQAIEETDKDMLLLARSLTPRLPVGELDVLIIRWIGKDLSGTGMDTKITGRMQLPPPEGVCLPHVRRIVALDLTPASHGNALGIGAAEFTTQKLLSKINHSAFFTNALTSTNLSGAKIPVTLPTDREALVAAMCTAWTLDPKTLRAIIIQDTKSLARIHVSEGLFADLQAYNNIEVLGPLAALEFDEAGTLHL